MFHVILVCPEIPPNTGNAIRLCANTGAQLHLVRPLGFELDDARMRRAGLDYHEWQPVRVHDTLEEALADTGAAPAGIYALTTHAQRSVADVAFKPGDVFVGRESPGCRTRISAVPAAAAAAAHARRAAQPEPVERGRGDRVRGLASAGLRRRVLIQRQVQLLDHLVPARFFILDSAGQRFRRGRRGREVLQFHCLRTAGLSMMRASSEFSRSITGVGVPAGASTAFHEIASKSG